jgi:hypothetical protein
MGVNDGSFPTSPVPETKFISPKSIVYEEKIIQPKSPILEENFKCMTPTASPIPEEKVIQSKSPILEDTTKEIIQPSLILEEKIMQLKASIQKEKAKEMQSPVVQEKVIEMIQPKSPVLEEKVQSVPPTASPIPEEKVIQSKSPVLVELKMTDTPTLLIPGKRTQLQDLIKELSTDELKMEQLWVIYIFPISL